jgi:ectoine hydroxylase-related dioxygenase (phytanoyl-CoA dioxygenase family)
MCIERNDLSLPDLSTHYSVTTDQINEYQTNGHILLKNICSEDEINLFRRVLKSVAMAKFSETRKMHDRPIEDFSRAFIQAFNLREINVQAAHFILAERFGKIVADLMGVDGVRIYYDKAMFKEPDSWITPWHQDGPHWPLFSDHVLTMWIPLVDAPVEMGPPKFASGTHTQKAFGPSGIHKTAQQFYDQYIIDNEVPVVEDPVLAGDATFHNHWLVHGAGNNKTNSMREVMAITFYKAGIKIDDSACEEKSKPIIDHMLGDRSPGELADHPRNQMVYPRDL